MVMIAQTCFCIKLRGRWTCAIFEKQLYLLIKGIGGILKGINPPYSQNSSYILYRVYKSYHIFTRNCDNQPITVRRFSQDMIRSIHHHFYITPNSISLPMISVNSWNFKNRQNLHFFAARIFDFSNWSHDDRRLWNRLYGENFWLMILEPTMITWQIKKRSNFMQQKKTVANGIFSIWFHGPEKVPEILLRLQSLQDFTLPMIHT